MKDLPTTELLLKYRIVTVIFSTINVWIARLAVKVKCQSLKVSDVCVSLVVNFLIISIEKRLQGLIENDVG